MAEHDLDTILGWRGRAVVDRHGERIGKVGDLYLDEATDRPAYAGVRTGLFGRHESIVPLRGIVERDGELVVPHEAAVVRDAPAIDPDAALDEREQERLASHYEPEAAETAAISAGAAERRGDEPDGDERDGDERDGDEPAAEGDGPEAEMVRSEEEVVSGTTPLRPAERVRIRKVLVTDNVERTVPVRREEIRLETDPPPSGEIESVEDAD